MDSPTSVEQRRSSILLGALCILGSLAAILGAKLWLIAEFGSSVPFWDQWIDATQIYRPYLTGNLQFSQLIAAHNEHRILLTRLAALAQFAAEGRWDPIGQTFVNAGVHIAAVGVMLVMLGRALNDGARLLLCAFAALTFALPFGWMNTLVGFQLQYYLLLLLAPLALWLLVPAAAWSLRWWIGTAVGVLSYFSVASGALTFPAFIAAALVQFAFGQRRGLREWLALALHAILAAVILLDVPRLEREAAFVVTFTQLVDVIATAASWPVSKNSWPLIGRALTAIGLYLPLLAIAWRLRQRRAPISDPAWLIVALGGWAVLLVGAISYGRGLVVLQSRYYDLILPGLLVCAGAALYLQADEGFPWKPLRVAFACAWFFAATVGLGFHAFDALPGDYTLWRDRAAAQVKNVTEYLRTGDYAALDNKPEFHIPWPVAGELRGMLDDPVIRSILPPELLGRPEPERFRRFMARQGVLLLPIGMALLLVAGLLMSVRRKADDVTPQSADG